MVRVGTKVSVVHYLPVFEICSKSMCYCTGNPTPPEAKAEKTAA